MYHSLSFTVLQNVYLHVFLILLEGGSEEQKPEELNKKALTIIQQVRDKLTGTVIVSLQTLSNSMLVLFK